MFKIYDGRKNFFQWDTDRKLIVEKMTVDDRVLFSNKLRENSIPCPVYELEGEMVCDVPNELLCEPADIVAYAYILDEHGQKTVYRKKFKVELMEKPDDYVYTETEILSYKALAERTTEQLEVNNVQTERLVDAVNSADKYIGEYEYEELVWEHDFATYNPFFKNIGLEAGQKVDFTYNDASGNCEYYCNNYGSFEVGDWIRISSDDYGEDIIPVLENDEGVKYIAFNHLYFSFKSDALQVRSDSIDGDVPNETLSFSIDNVIINPQTMFNIYSDKIKISKQLYIVLELMLPNRYALVEYDVRKGDISINDWEYVFINGINSPKYASNISIWYHEFTNRWWYSFIFNIVKGIRIDEESDSVVDTTDHSNYMIAFYSTEDSEDAKIVKGIKVYQITKSLDSRIGQIIDDINGEVV